MNANLFIGCVSNMKLDRFFSANLLLGIWLIKQRKRLSERTVFFMFKKKYSPNRCHNAEIHARGISVNNEKKKGNAFKLI